MSTQYAFRGKFECKECRYKATLYANVRKESHDVDECDGCGEATEYRLIDDKMEDVL